VKPLQHHNQPSRDHRAVSRRQPRCRQARADAGRVSGLPGNTDTGRELAMMRWGMPPPPKFGGPPVTNIRNAVTALARLPEAGEPPPCPG